MCFPPFCVPADRFLGCFSLRTGAIVVLIANGIYGLAMVVVHALLLGDEDQLIVTTTLGPNDEGFDAQQQQQQQQQQMTTGGSNTEPPSSADDRHWVLQLLDLDIGISHELLGFEDFMCLVSGLLYGIVIVILCGLMFNAVFMRGSSLPTTARWFVAFINFEIVLYIGLVLAKLPKLCKIQNEYLPRLEMGCDLQRFLYLERVVVGLTVAGLGCWVFSSLAYKLTVGDQVLDKPEFAMQLEAQDQLGPMQGAYHGGFQRAPPPGSRIPMSQHPAHVQGSYGYGGGPVGAPVGVAGSRRPGTAGTLGRMPMGGGAPQRTSYSIPNHGMARASSSMVTSTTAHSQAPETQSLIRPPMAVY